MERWVADLLHPEHLHQAVQLWQADSEPEMVSAVENFVYFLERDGHRLVLRLTHSSHRTAAQIAGELEWIAYLSGRGVRACSPLPSCNGRLAEILPAADGCFVAAVFKPAPGRRVRKDDPETWNAALFRHWGRTLGRMHRATRGYQVSDPAIRRPEWHEEDLLVNAPRYLPESEVAARAALAECQSWLRSLPRDPESYGLIHTDLHHSNFHADGHKITVFDFDDCTYHWFSYDLAVPLYYALCDIPLAQSQQRADQARELFLPLREGYEEEAALAPFWWEQIPRFMRLRDLILFVFCHKKFDRDHLTEGQAAFIEHLRSCLTADRPYELPI